MSPQTLGILIGGIVPMFCFGIANVFFKAGETKVEQISQFLLASIVGFAVVAAIFFFTGSEKVFSTKPVLFGFLWGIFGGFGAAFAIVGVTKYKAPLSVLVPIFNTNTLLAVLLALWIFAEWKQVKVPQLLIGSVLIVVGGTLVAKA